MKKDKIVFVDTNVIIYYLLPFSRHHKECQILVDNNQNINFITSEFCYFEAKNCIGEIIRDEVSNYEKNNYWDIYADALDKKEIKVARKHKKKAKRKINYYLEKFSDLLSDAQKIFKEHTVNTQKIGIIFDAFIKDKENKINLKPGDLFVLLSCIDYFEGINNSFKKMFLTMDEDDFKKEEIKQLLERKDIHLITKRGEVEQY